MGRRTVPPIQIQSSAAMGQSLGETFFMLRRRLGKTQDEIAEASGITRNYLSMLERNRANPTLEVVARIFTALGYATQFTISDPTEAAGGAVGAPPVGPGVNQAQ